MQSWLLLLLLLRALRRGPPKNSSLDRLSAVNSLQSLQLDDCLGLCFRWGVTPIEDQVSSDHLK